MSAENLNRELENMIGETDTKVPGLGVIIFKDGKEIFSKFLGVRNVENKKPVTRQTRFRAASVSKMFTIFSVMQLVEQGKINLDSDASEYLNFSLRNPNFPQKKITVRNLASHTSSLRDGKIYSIPPEISIREFFYPEGKFFEGGAHFAKETVGEFFSYCNLNYGILGTIIENVTGKRFDIYQRENILTQLETKAEYLPANFDDAEFENLGTVYQKKNSDGIWNEFGEWFGKADDFKGIKPKKNFVTLQNPYDENFQKEFSLKNYRVGTNATIFSPQGGLRISFEELANTLEMLMNEGIFHGKKILSKNSVREIFTPQWIYNPKNKNGNNYNGAILSYGLGIYFIDGKSSARVCKNREINFVGHTGEAFGMLSGLFFIPNTKTGFIYMMNGEAIAEDSDPRSFGKFSGNYIWEEKIMNAICENLL